MGRHFEELDWQNTEMGEISLRRRLDRTVQVDVYEVKLGDEFLMSSLFPVAEIELARLGLAACDGDAARRRRGRARAGVHRGHRSRGAAGAFARRRRGPRTGHRLAREAAAPGCRLAHHRPAHPDRPGDFFALAAASDGFGPEEPRLVHAVLLDIDHSPRHVLHPGHAAFYTSEGLVALRAHLHPGGVFALWSDDPPDEDFVAVAREVFGSVEAHVVTFANPLTRGTSSNTVYVATG